MTDFSTSYVIGHTTGLLSFQLQGLLGAMMSFNFQWKVEGTTNELSLM